MKATSLNSRKWFMPFIWLISSILFVTELYANEPSKQTMDSVYTIVDRLPAFRGRPSNIHRFVRSNLIYPDEAWINGIEGVVKVSFIITKDGKLMNAAIEESIDPLLDMEALRIVDMMTDWRPGRKNGVDVHTQMSIPVQFTLSEEEREFVSTLKRFELHENPPLYVIDGKIVHSRIHLPSHNVKSIRVLKGESAIERYGDGALNGVVVITTKRGTPPIR
ncbi:energy transducer TonB [Alkalitalea saponilacus]|uniref:TonB family C-terminal domain-containing protein n=1 Tax=Alkalitalea saponilacus TaxID=889453 RepID=A0A1T5D783_9BACT|nr:energy transducer TonB [Alkalitalea saponilacus]ASB50599.1 energy transducer TonB [Alkalitalea saponilacus]SKB67393.1 TonB family C-terminal domain-containing protein [Alkalitalea saponilacus]